MFSYKFIDNQFLRLLNTPSSILHFSLTKLELLNFVTAYKHFVPIIF